MGNEIAIVGQTFARLTVLEKTRAKSGGHVLFRCICACGAETLTTSFKLRTGYTRSCGCLALEKARAQRKDEDAVRRDPIYAIWHAIISRCDNPQCASYANYGARGIKLREDWYDFSTFKNGIGPRPPGTELDRRDNSQGYMPGNVRWVTKPINSRNRRSNVFLDFRGQRMCQKDAALASGIPEHVLIRRRANGITDESALFAPVRRIKAPCTPPAPNPSAAGRR